MTQEQMLDLLRTRKEQFADRYPSFRQVMKGYGDTSALLEYIYAGYKDREVFKQAAIGMYYKNKRVNDLYVDYVAARLKFLLSQEELKIHSIKKTMLPCLLYTSPSPRDRQKSRMPSSA